MSSKVPVIENRNKEFIDFVKKNTNWEIHKLTEEVKDYATLFGLDRVFISVEHKESIQKTVIINSDVITTSGSTFTNYIVD